MTSEESLFCMLLALSISLERVRHDISCVVKIVRILRAFSAYFEGVYRIFIRALHELQSPNLQLIGPYPCCPSLVRRTRRSMERGKNINHTLEHAVVAALHGALSPKWPKRGVRSTFFLFTGRKSTLQRILSKTPACRGSHRASSSSFL